MHRKAILSFLFTAFLHFSLATDNRPISEAEEKADELLLKARLSAWKFLQAEEVRNVMSVFLSSVETVMNDESASQIMIDVTGQMAQLLIDKQTSTSIELIFKGLTVILVEPDSDAKIEGILKGLIHVMQDPNFVIVIHEKFDLATAFVQVYRGAELIDAISNGLVRILQSKDPKAAYIKAFTNMKYLIFTKLMHKAKRFFSGR